MIFPFLADGKVTHHEVFSDPEPPRYHVVREFTGEREPSLAHPPDERYIAQRLSIYVERTYSLRVFRFGGESYAYTPPRVFYQAL